MWFDKLTTSGDRPLPLSLSLSKAPLGVLIAPLVRNSFLTYENLGWTAG